MARHVSLNVAIPVDLDRSVEIHVATVRTTKKRFVTEAIQEKLERDRAVKVADSGERAGQGQESTQAIP